LKDYKGQHKSCLEAACDSQSINPLRDNGTYVYHNFFTKQHAVENNWSKTWNNGQKSMFLVLFKIKHCDKIGQVVGRLVEVLGQCEG